MVPVNLDWADNGPDWPVKVEAGAGAETGTEGRSAGLVLASGLEG